MPAAAEPQGTMFRKRPNGKLSVDPEVAYNELERIRETFGTAPGHKLEREHLVAEARKRGNPLHKEFEWDDSKAAHLQRLDRAGEIIRSVECYAVIEHEKAPRPVMAYAHVGGREPGYLPIAVVMSNPDMREEVVATALKQLMGFKRRYEHLHELAKVWRAMDEVENEILPQTRRRGRRRR